MAMSKSGKAAIGLPVLAMFLLLLAFFSKNWLVSDGNVHHPEIERIGLWGICFKDYEESHHLFDTKFNNCLWVYDEKCDIINEILMKDFYIATRLCFTVCVILTFIGFLNTIFYLRHNRSFKYYVFILHLAGAFYGAAAICGTIALIIFAIHGYSRTWIPNWEHNAMGWSFGVAVAGVTGLFLSSALTFIEGRVNRIKHQKLIAKKDLSTV